MRDDIKELLKRYDEIGALILEQKLDEFGDQLDQKPADVDDATYEEYIQRLAKEETEEATAKLENEPDEKLGGKSMRQVFDEMDFEEKTEALEYAALNLELVRSRVGLFFRKALDIFLICRLVNAFRLLIELVAEFIELLLKYQSAYLVISIK